MKVLILLVATLAVVSASENFFSLGDYADEMGEAGNGCCLPTQWEGRVGAVHITKKFLKPKVRATDSKIGLDFAGQKVGVRSMFYCAKAKKVFTAQTIADYTAKKAYFIFGKKCKSFSLKRSLVKPCIPDFFKQFGSYFYGAGDTSLALTPYGFRNASRGLEVFSVVTKDSCVPIKGAFRVWRGRSSVMGNYQYYNITKGNKDTDLYTVPDFCNQANETTYQPRGLWLKFKKFVGYIPEEPFNQDSEFGELADKDALTQMMDIIDNNAMMLMNVDHKHKSGRDLWYQRGWDNMESRLTRIRGQDD